MRRNGHGKPIISLDIDGTLADYHYWFLRFAEMYFGRHMPTPEAINPGLPLYKFMGVRRDDYRDCKLAYRQGGMKRSMPCLIGAAEVVREIRRAGCEVWICTTRPYMRLDNIDPDTQEWLRRNSIEYDALLYDPRDGDSKYRELARQARGRVVLGCAEDLPEQADRAMRALRNPPIWLRNRPYNRTAWKVEPREGGITGFGAGEGEPYRVHRWDTADDLRSLAEKAIYNYQTHGRLA